MARVVKPEGAVLLRDLARPPIAAAYPLHVRIFGRAPAVHEARVMGVARLHLQQWLPVATFAVVLVWYVVAPSEAAAMGAVTLGGLLLAAYLWARAMARHVGGTRQLRYAAAQVGDELEELLTLKAAASKRRAASKN